MCNLVYSEVGGSIFFCDCGGGHGLHCCKNLDSIVMSDYSPVFYFKYSLLEFSSTIFIFSIEKTGFLNEEARKI